ncbi:hypothetical protein AVEN_68842-1 [Araneus ventricosus]|uniref:Integrase catalytic domain-containing protein n=1 Tax=Araneus ventricosus TaxID=182803 RepID=A0A4Y2C534_ARAVE|nr:hypothetical protein AVEN_68842-1 [Araneus ventricosus]
MKPSRVVSRGVNPATKQQRKELQCGSSLRGPNVLPLVLFKSLKRMVPAQVSSSSSELDEKLRANRVRYTNVFEVTCIDLAGPLFLKNGENVWIVLFTCAIYRAVHFELTNSLTTNNFLLRFHRFIAKRGRPSVVYTDNVTNFKGTFLEFKNLNWMKIERETEIQRIKWEFIPPTAPWCGRWWERLLIKLKDLLKRTLGKAVLTYEELLTVSCDYESIINSRTLIYVSEDLDYQVPITPAMFLMTNSYLFVTDLDLRDRWTLKLAKIDQNIENIFCYINILLIFLNHTHKTACV